jgi:hypothetical protein
MDCRINAYPDYTAYHGINRQPPNFIFIDIDRCLFRTDKEFWLALEQTLKNMEQSLGVSLLYYGVAMESISINQYKL